MLLSDGKPATEWILARYDDRLTEQEVDLLRGYYLLDEALTTGEIAEKYHMTGQVVLERRHKAVRRLSKLISWERDDSSKKNQERFAELLGTAIDLRQPLDRSER